MSKLASLAHPWSRHSHLVSPGSSHLIDRIRVLFLVCMSVHQLNQSLNDEARQTEQY